MVLTELRMCHDIHQSGLTADKKDLWQAADRLGLQLAIFDDAQPAFAFHNKHGAVGKKRQAVGVHQVLRDRNDANLIFLGVEQFWRRIHRARWTTTTLTATAGGAGTAAATTTTAFALLSSKSRQRET